MAGMKPQRSGQGPYDEFIELATKGAIDRVEAAIENNVATFTGVPYGAATLGPEEFVYWFEDNVRKQGPNWIAFLPLEDSGEGTKTLKRYEKLRLEGYASTFGGEG